MRHGRYSRMHIHTYHLILLYMCPHTALYVSSYHYICVFKPECMRRANLRATDDPSSPTMHARTSCIRRYTLAYVSIRHLTSSPTMHARTSCIRRHTLAYVGMRQHTSSYLTTYFTSYFTTYFTTVISICLTDTPPTATRRSPTHTNFERHAGPPRVIFTTRTYI
jgi:hypothetical protein